MILVTAGILNVIRNDYHELMHQKQIDKSLINDGLSNTSKMTLLYKTSVFNLWWFFCYKTW